MVRLDAVRVRRYFDTLPRTDEEYEAPSPLPTTLPSPSPPPATEPPHICLEQMDWIQDTVVESKVR